MLLREYLDHILSIIKKYSIANLILASDIRNDFRTEKVGIIRGRIDFINESTLYFTEYLDLRYGVEKLSYSFHYQNRDGNLIFRYDNAGHKPELECRDHKHLSDGHTVPFHTPEFKYIFDEITEHLL
ncbi:MAG: hypothetical protein CO012_04450 [Syntrophobacterales bacterium CG_4_8_14_3_um_filter_49_14]|nr:MAG: hypothetical protein COX52_13075 [Syntrophobacterales bacterium CG23_combo_of_CG06-09_8_20_14_all_48_27]PJC75027.1 MAG: hypothetical protein CO012_04450 [Syntrophobacterales bacterium CG_4_8_14_3_um_filter_49_14]